MVLSINVGSVQRSFQTRTCELRNLALPPVQSDLSRLLKTAKASAPIPQGLQWVSDNGETYKLLVTYSGEIPTCTLCSIGEKSSTQVWRVITEDAEQLRKMISKHNPPVSDSDSIRNESQQPMNSAPQAIRLQSCFLNRFLITELVGEGGMGVVYKATDQRLGRAVALKMLRSDRMQESILKQRFKKEMSICVALKHPNIVSVFDYGYDSDSNPFMVMEYVRGLTLNGLLSAQRTLSIPVFVSIFSQLCSALVDAHKISCIHRDLKPENIMVIPQEDGSYFVKLLDFGIAKIVGQENTLQKLTNAGDALGSPFYMSPEQCRGLEQDARSDIYSLGCVMYESIAGKPPFDESDAISILASHVSQKVEPLSNVMKDSIIPAQLERIVLKALEKNPDDRYQTAAELADDLARFSEAYAKPDLRLTLLTQSGIITCEEALAANALHQTEGKDAVEYLLEFGLITDVIYKSVIRCSDLIANLFLSIEDAASMLLYCYNEGISFDAALAQFE